jgi:hypothetical protein
MLTAQAHVRTERPSRYLVQLCRHAGQMSRHLGRVRTAHAGADPAPEVTHVEWSDTHGTVELNWGRWTLEAAHDTLTLTAEATDEHNLRRIQDLLSARLEQIGRRDRLTVTWQAVQMPTDHAARTPPGQPHRIRRHRSQAARWSLVAVIALLVTVHIGFGGAAFTASAWTAVALVAVLGLKVIGLRLFLRRRVANNSDTKASTGRHTGSSTPTTITRSRGEGLPGCGEGSSR